MNYNSRFAIKYRIRIIKPLSNFINVNESTKLSCAIFECVRRFLSKFVYITQRTCVIRYDFS